MQRKDENILFEKLNCCCQYKKDLKTFAFYYLNNDVSVYEKAKVNF